MVWSWDKKVGKVTARNAYGPNCSKHKMVAFNLAMAFED